MLISPQVAGHSDAMVSECGLDSLSIFFRNRSSGPEGLTYLYHNGISQAAQSAYLQDRVFEEDPFIAAVNADDRAGQLIWWEDDRLSCLADRAAGYRDFINRHDVDVVGAWVQQIYPDFFLVIGAHCRPNGHRKSDVARRRFAAEITAISQMVIGQLLEETLTRIGGPAMLGSLLPLSSRHDADPLLRLSARESQIARLVGSGKQNKEIAYIAGISEFTVENHLRRIYRKLDVRNRAAMTAMLLGSHTYQ